MMGLVTYWIYGGKSLPKRLKIYASGKRITMDASGYASFSKGICEEYECGG
ncbi:hypothetical protein SAMN05878482_105436 [Peribacillus simplex]|uniref:Uncharacterized protein n=1 Tax=Peribacillus simplex TaxID=1478 RepID=A0A9X8RBM5_9BACI|nr:hypothetical protein SAMN05878482_105436 [Peribacillus simplex]